MILFVKCFENCREMRMQQSVKDESREMIRKRGNQQAGCSSGTKKALRLSLTAPVPWVLVGEAGLLGDEDLSVSHRGQQPQDHIVLCEFPESWPSQGHVKSTQRDCHRAGTSGCRGAESFQWPGDVPALASEENTVFVSQAPCCTNILEKIVQEKKGNECLVCKMCRSERPTENCFPTVKRRMLWRYSMQMAVRAGSSFSDLSRDWIEVDAQSCAGRAVQAPGEGSAGSWGGHRAVLWLEQEVRPAQQVQLEKAVSAQGDGQRAALRALWAVPRILDFIPTEMRSHWKFLNGKVIDSN